MDYLGDYWLERYLFEDVRQRFHTEQAIGAFDFFSIVVWKANRAKSRIAKRLLMKAPDLELAARELTGSLYRAPDERARLRVLSVDWNLRLPTASAILAVLWPDKFTVYDIRVCQGLRGHDRRDYSSVLAPFG